MSLKFTSSHVDSSFLSWKFLLLIFKYLLNFCSGLFILFTKFGSSKLGRNS